MVGPSDVYRYSPDFGALVCTLRGCAPVPSALKSHLADVHKRLLNLCERRDCLKYYDPIQQPLTTPQPKFSGISVLRLYGSGRRRITRGARSPGTRRGIVRKVTCRKARLSR